MNGGAEITADAEKGVQFAQGLLKKAPKLERSLLWEAFWDMRSMAPSGMGLSLIPVDKIHWYADVELGLDEDEKSAFVWIMRRVDSHFVSRQNEKTSKSSK